MKRPGTVEDVSKNKAALAVSNEEGWTVVELIGSEGKIAVGDTVIARDWLAVGSEELYSTTKCSAHIFKGTATGNGRLGK
jgi:hypothetical protein